MKLYLIVDYNKDYAGNFTEDSDGYCTSTNVNVRSSSAHEHESCKNLKDFIAYRAFEKNFCRSRYSKFEYPLIDVPDDLMFQLMLTGVQDYDYIAYNHITKKIYIGTSSHDTSMYASCPDDRMNDRKSYYSGSVGLNDSLNKNSFFEYVYDYHHEKKEREDYCIAIDSTNGYEDVKEALMPYIIEKYYKDFQYCSNFLIRNSIIIGRQSSAYSQYYNDSPVASANEMCDILQIPREDMAFIFTSFIEDDELYIKNKHRFMPSKIEVIRSFSVDILTNFTEKTEYN
ncbi:hypothetical protein GNZ01_07060 [Escherichia coli]|uniref:Uncharacterized protein n=2 Tax=root TaxID=1 RepID=A0AAJ2Y347_ECOLX|nr:hypothetical protein [Escherichia coli]YP_009102002.1 hypothetical protein PBI_121Q_415 [Escherichia phage 121Q]MED6562188.1 hypothetical protein [Escherichia coli O157]AIT14305.1 hypothetical protein PBI_121Q_415 [Escherichia phage 121Q]EGE5868301.1 hypothetical protein [Escherichia coli]EKR8628502.1 hypothetical protein [Escherichia coli]ELQ3159160.1 hypothetical protein [Escherichia coli]